MNPRKAVLVNNAYPAVQQVGDETTAYLNRLSETEIEIVAIRYVNGRLLVGQGILPLEPMKYSPKKKKESTDAAPAQS